RLYRIDWYPGMRLDEEGVPVRGEIYEIEREALRELDVFEGKEFERLKTKVHAKGGGDFHVWLYEYCREVDYGAELLPADWAHHERKNDRKVPAPLFSLATFILLPATAALGAFMTWSDPDSSSRILQTVSIVLPLLAFLTGRKAHARQERWAEGAEVCAAVAFIVFCLMLLIRFLPSAFEAFPN
ncbi:MAG TPA: hypothetical protein DIV39_03145, partial [Verrucomicrobiales bacterium]|nr:hypothetical protein [Verrucomicrobiales bacterium]